MLLTTKIPLSLYIHLPWCVRKCPYCDFNSHKARDNLPEELYVAALIKDLHHQLPRIQGRPLTSIFFGGGTPSLFQPTSIEKILNAVHRVLPFSSDLEITLEANPGTVDKERFRGFRQAGINRLSIGVQSLQNEKLKALGRIHDRDHALKAIETAINIGFHSFNLDLMHGLPNQSIEDAIADLKDALQFQPPHLSWYQLTIEPNTLFHHQPPVLPPDDILWDIQESGKELLSHAGLSSYEVSAYTKPHQECAHNKNYWEFGDYLGIGAGAHSKITDFENQTIDRHWQFKHPNDYMDIKKLFVAETKKLSQHDLMFEFILNALRLTNGVDNSVFEERTGLSLDIIAPQLKIAREKKLLTDDPNKLQATELGQRFLNNVIGIFL